MKQYSFFRLVLSEDGTPSAKRVAFFIALTWFLFIATVNLFTGKSVAQVILDDLFFIIQSLLVSIIGVSVANLIADVKKTQSSNNAKVGAPSPTPPTVVTPESEPVKP
jgi:hypothetical protein